MGGRLSPVASMAAVDVQYGDPIAAAACVTFADWTDVAPVDVHTALVRVDEAYVPGEFWRRELRPILEVLTPLRARLQLVVVDGYVVLGVDRRPGLGWHVSAALGGVPVVGVAKSRFEGTPGACAVRRGGSARALYVTAVGLGLEEAKTAIRRMAGPHRVPDLLSVADRAARRALEGAGDSTG